MGKVIKRLKREEEGFSREKGGVWANQKEARGKGARWAGTGPCPGRGTIGTCIVHGGA